MNAVITPDTPATALSPLHLPLQGGLTLIEASAGTGKTWTLAMLMVRLLLERELLPRQIVVTTFTRAAAAELRSRIRDRLAEVRQVLDQALRLLSAGESQLSAAAQAELAGDDVFLQHWLQSRPARQWTEDANRLQLALDTLDECFIGTLDSFCQKLLREFAFDLGDSRPLTISATEQEMLYELTHAALRRWQGEQPPEVLRLMLTTGQMPRVDTLVQQAQTALNSLSVPFAPLTTAGAVQAAEQQLEQALQALRALRVDWRDFEDFFNPLDPKTFWGGRTLATSRHLLPDLVQQLGQSQSLGGFWHLPESHQALLRAFGKLPSMFGAPGKSLREWMEQQPLTQVLARLAEATTTLNQHFEQLKQALRLRVLTTVREQLPVRLAAQGETTFGLQMRHLAHALGQEEQRSLARTIRQRYPVAMVDEFQDTNGDQDRVIAQIYRHPDALAGQDREPATLILVGDPKQAIYGFRGGDIRTYNAARADILAKKGRLLSLAVNQRSVAPLVQAVDALLQVRPELGDEVQYQPVQPSARPHPALVCPQGINAGPLRELRMVDQSDEAVQTAWAIRQLLQQARAGTLGFGALQADGRACVEQPLRPDDVAVLAVGHHSLDAVQAELERLHIPYWRNAQTSVYASPMARELVQLMEAMLNPWQHSLLRRVLSGLLGGHSLAELQALEQSRRALNLFAERLSQASEQWSARGFLAAWSVLADPRDATVQGQPRFWLNVARLSGRTQAERHLIDLRHLLENLHQQHERVAGPHHLLAWLQQQILRQPRGEGDVQRPVPAASGVRLMTIHASKGLEFPVVFVLGLDKPARAADAGDLKFFQDPQGQSRLSVENHEERVAQHQRRLDSEKRRLAYVALTRPSHRLYLVLQADPAKSSSSGNNKKEEKTPSPLRYWLEAGVPVPLPSEPLQDHAPKPYDPRSGEAPPLTARTRRRLTHRGWLTTSYTALMRQAQQYSTTVVSAEEDETADDEEILQDALTAVTAPRPVEAPDLSHLPICFRFARGAAAGDCLHQILENIDPRHPDKWPELLENRLRDAGLYQSPGQIDELQGWLQDIVQAELPDQARLADMDYGQRLRELDFMLPLGRHHDATTRWKKIQQLLQAHRPELAALTVYQSEKYLKGSIDLVYVHQERYYIADYKSNLLGLEDGDYDLAHMQACMDHSNYWLQALIYQVALHRLLRWRLGAAYDPARHLGGVCYLFLRGMRAGRAQGVLFWSIPTDLLLQADQCLGQALPGETGRA